MSTQVEIGTFRFPNSSKALWGRESPATAGPAQGSATGWINGLEGDDIAAGAFWARCLVELVRLARGRLRSGVQGRSVQGSGPELDNQATLRRETGDLTGAMAAFDHAVETAPNRVVTHISRADAGKAAYYLDVAMLNLDRADELAPDFGLADVLHHRGGVRVLQDDFKGDIADYDRAIWLDPGFALGLPVEGPRTLPCDFRRLADYLTALWLDPEAAIQDLARLFLADVARDPEAVLADCDKPLRIDRGDIPAHARRGLILFAPQPRPPVPTLSDSWS